MVSQDIKSNKFSVYLIKSEFQTVADIATSREAPLEIDGVGQFVFDESHPHPPDWVEKFFGSTLDGDRRFLTASAKGILIVPITDNGKTVNFAVSFGFGRHLLKEGVIEERFGLKTVLNSIDRSSLRSIDKTALGSVPKHSREQMSRDVAASDFGIDIEQDLVSSVTGKSRDAELGHLITGKDALSGSAKVDITNIKTFLAHCLARYKSRDYVKDYGWIDQIADVRDGRLEDELNAVIVGKLNSGDLDKIWMAVPETVDWPDVKGFRYIRAKRADMHDDLSMKEFLKVRGATVTIEDLKQLQVFMISASTDELSERWSVYRCMYAELTHNGEIYILNSGKWYKIAKGFADTVKKDFDSIPRSTIALPDCTVVQEGEYNTSATAVLTGACCMDGELVSYGGGHSSIEFCDIYTSDKKIVHVKRYGGSSVLSHLFSQGVVSGELFVSESDFRDKLNAKLPASHRLADTKVQPDAHEYEVIYGIISDSDKALDIPFFSKVSLKNARRRLSLYGYNVSIKQIKRSTAATAVAAHVEAAVAV